MFEKRFIAIAGRLVPAIQQGADQVANVTLASGKIIPAVFADMISLRETNPDNGPVTTYLTVTRENKRFTVLRSTNVVGLDVDADGTLLTIEDLEARRAEDILARQAANMARKAPVSIALNTLLGIVAESEPEPEPEGEPA